MSNQDWSHLGDEIKDVVQSAIDSKDFTRLNESIGKTVNQALDRFEEILDGNGGSINSGEGCHTGAKSRNPSQSTGNRKPGEKETYRQFSTEGRVGIRKNQDKIFNPFKAYEERYASPVSSRIFGILSSVFGGIIAAGCSIAEFVMLLVAAAVFSGNVPFGMPLAMGILVPFIVGGGLLAGSGWKKLGLIRRYKKYVSFLGAKEYCELEDLECSTGRSHKKVLKDLRRMIDKGWFRQGHLDQQETSLIVTNQAYSQYLEAQKEFKRRQLEEKQHVKEEKNITASASAAESASSGDPGEKAALPREVQEVIGEGRGYLKQIKESNDAIPGVEISAKISRLELVTERIFNRVEQHPELVEELRRFMKYYLPTTVKLLKAYEDLDRQAIQGPNILKSKGEIEDTLDTINRAFENLLDSFFEDTAVDISSDISVMQTLMAQEGLLGSSIKERIKEKEKVLR